MPSPFPGMNPYLEQSDCWEDFHHRFITHAADTLSGQVGPHYLAKVEVRLYVHKLGEEERRYFGRADVAVAGRPETLPLHAASEAVVSAPVQLALPELEVQKIPSLEIYDRRQRRVITAIELLSPTNKTSGEHHLEYLAKRNVLFAGRTHFVEIDLLRGGTRPEIPELPQCDYYVLISRVEDRPRLGMWPVGLRERLPVIPIPLRAPDPDVKLDLQALLDRVYDAAQYGKYIYGGEPDPPLSSADAEWARQFLPG